MHLPPGRWILPENSKSSYSLCFVFLLPEIMDTTLITFMLWVIFLSFPHWTQIRSLFTCIACALIIPWYTIGLKETLFLHTVLALYITGEETKRNGKVYPLEFGLNSVEVFAIGTHSGLGRGLPGGYPSLCESILVNELYAMEPFLTGWTFVMSLANGICYLKMSTTATSLFRHSLGMRDAALVKLYGICFAKHMSICKMPCKIRMSIETGLNIRDHLSIWIRSHFFHSWFQQPFSQATARTQSVDLVGSWDNFTKRYPMERDSRRSREQWRGCHTFDDIICDGDGNNSMKRTGGLKMASTYYYYVCLLPKNWKKVTYAFM